MLPFLKMLDMIPDTNGIQNAIAKQLRQAQGSMEKGKGQHAAFFEILNNLTSADTDQLKGMAIELFHQEAGQAIDDQSLAGHAPYGGLSRFQLVRQLFAKFTAQEQKGLPSSENNCPTEKDKRHHGDDLAWWQTVLPMLDPQAIEADTDPLATNPPLHEGSVSKVDVALENGEKFVDEFVATKSLQGMDLYTTETREAKAGLSMVSDKIDEALFRESSDLIDEAKPARDKGKSIVANSSAIKKNPSEIKVFKHIPSDPLPLTGRELKQDEVFTQPKNVDVSTDVSVARPFRPSPPGLADSDINQVRQSHVMDDQTIKKGVDPKPDATMARHARPDPPAFKPDSDEQPRQWDKEGNRPIQADPRFKRIFKETKKMGVSTASTKPSENTSKQSTAQQAPPMQDPKVKQEQLAFAQKTSETNSVVLSEKDQVSVLAAKQDDTTIETISQKPLTDQPDKTISKPSEIEPSAPTKEERIDVIRQIVQRMTLRQSGAQSQMIIRLKPDMLGQLRMQVISENHQLAVRMTAESFAVKDLIEQNLHHLKSELNLHGLEIQKIDVTVQNDNQDSRQGQDPTGFEQFARKNEEERKRRQNQQTAFEQKEDAPAPVKHSDNRHIGSNSGEVDYFV